MTRKILVPIDIENPDKVKKGILYPKPTKNGFILTDIKTDKKSDFGMVVLTNEKNENELFKKIIDSRNEIESAENLLNTLREYVEKMPSYKIGNILKISNIKRRLEF